MKTRLVVLILLLSVNGSSQAALDVLCGKLFVPALGYDTMEWIMDWDTLDEAIYDLGVVGVAAAGPVPASPFFAYFLAPSMPNNEMEVMPFNPTPGVWTIDGDGVLFFIQGSQAIIHPSGLQECTASDIL